MHTNDVRNPAGGSTGQWQLERDDNVFWHYVLAQSFSGNVSLNAQGAVLEK
jgi:hypothetical protein